jgi:hypothetical protein
MFSRRSTIAYLDIIAALLIIAAGAAVVLRETCWQHGRECEHPITFTSDP